MTKLEYEQLILKYQNEIKEKDKELERMRKNYNLLESMYRVAAKPDSEWYEY